MKTPYLAALLRLALACDAGRGFFANVDRVKQQNDNKLFQVLQNPVGHWAIASAVHIRQALYMYL